MVGGGAARANPPDAIVSSSPAMQQPGGGRKMTKAEAMKLRMSQEREGGGPVGGSA